MRCFASCTHAPGDGAFTLPAVWTDWGASKARQTAGQCQAKLPEPDRGTHFHLNLVPLSEERPLPLVPDLDSIPVDHNFVLWIQLAKHSDSRAPGP